MSCCENTMKASSEDDAVKVEIRHQTRYQYMDRVFLEPHTLRLTPRSAAHVKVCTHAVAIHPQPAGSSQALETDGTIANMVWFEGMTDQLTVDACTVLETRSFNPFAFLICPESCTRLPMVYPSEWLTWLRPYLMQGKAMEPLTAFAGELLQGSRFDTVAFLMNLCSRIKDTFRYEKREEGAPNPPLKTLDLKKGSCRDFAVFAMAVCQQLGLACRYAGGYLLSDSEEEPGELHAWFEVYLPGGGWRGFDPSHAVACSENYITLSSSADPGLTLPVSGAYRGVASSNMKVRLDICSLDG